MFFDTLNPSRNLLPVLPLGGVGYRFQIRPLAPGYRPHSWQAAGGDPYDVEALGTRGGRSSELISVGSVRRRRDHVVGGPAEDEMTSLFSISGNDAGYATMCLAKWHIGDAVGRWPTDHGSEE